MYADEQVIRDELKDGDIVAVYTPDNFHYRIAMTVLKSTKKLHLIIAKPAFLTVAEHLSVLSEYKRKGLNTLLMVEYHKRWDPVYRDALERLTICPTTDAVSYFYSWMSQPKRQVTGAFSQHLHSTDINFYLNSHHVDFHCLVMKRLGYVPISVSAVGSNGILNKNDFIKSNHPSIHDSITLLVTFKRKKNSGLIEETCAAVYSAAWSSPDASPVYSAQEWHALANGVEIRVNQGRRGYEIANDKTDSFSFVNPLFFRYGRDEKGNFDGEFCYGYKILEDFILACHSINNHINNSPLDSKFPLLTNEECLWTTMILEGGQRSLAHAGKLILFSDEFSLTF